MTNKKSIRSISTTMIESKNEEGIVHYPTSRRFIVRVKIKNTYHSLKSFRFKKDAIEFYNNWLLENR